MELNESSVKHRENWEKAGYKLPKYDRKKAMAATKEKPYWIHFGAGNLFRAFQARVAQNLLEQGVTDRGIVAVEGFDYEIVEKVYHTHDNYSLSVTLKANGSVEKTVIGSIMEARVLDAQNKAEFDRLKEIFTADSLQIASFTITEKGYALTSGKDEILPAVAADYENGPSQPISYLGKVTALLYARFQAGKKPLAMVSMDNCSHNGSKLHHAVSAFAKMWKERGLAEEGFLEYVNNPQMVSFPWSMIDKITPRPDRMVEQILLRDGLEGMETIVTSRGTYVAPFVNSEECEYLVIEDRFPNGRPPMEKAGLIFADRETVDKVEKMKVCTCLNPLHTVLAVFGCLLGYESIAMEMQDKDLVKLVEHIGYDEGLPVVIDPGVLDPKEFIDTVLKIRFPNPFMPDTPQRIATDTSQKLAIRFGETIKAYERSSELSVTDLSFIPLVFAGWIRYLMAIDDEGKTFRLSPDPMLDMLQPYISQLSLGEELDFHHILRPVLENEQLFGINLYKAGMADLVCDYLKQMLTGMGAVRATLQRYV